MGFPQQARVTQAQAAMPPELRDAAPPTGAVCALVLTERQYSSITYLVGGPSYQELAVGEWDNISL